MRVTAAVALCVVLGACKATAPDSVDLPDFAGKPLELGALLCVSGAFSAKASTLEQAVTLAEEYINGSTRFFEGAADAIPCRVNNTCGAWMGRDGSGNEIRGQVRVTIADTEQRVDRATTAAADLMAERGPLGIIGPCTVDEMENVFSQDTGTETVLISPVVSADSISDLPDQTAQDIANNLPGYAYRLVSPDYTQVQVMAIIAGNDKNQLIRFEDRTDQLCTDNSTCDAGLQCLASTRSPIPDVDYVSYMEDKLCAGKPESFCTGQSACTTSPTSGNQVCATYRLRKYCTKVVQPSTGMVLYDAVAGGDQMQELDNYWTGPRGKLMLATQSFDPTNPSSFSTVISSMFANAQSQLDAYKTDGTLAADSSLGDSVVFLMAQSSDAALLLQEWDLQKALLPDGAAEVFWMGPDSLRSSLLTNLVKLDVIRNLYVLDPYSVSDASSDFFTQAFQQRWGEAPTQYAGTAFDAVLFLAAANERAGVFRGAAQASGALAPNTAADLKDSLPIVTIGCQPAALGQPCTNQFTVVAPTSYQDAVMALRGGREIKLLGVTGDSALSPAGDRLNTMRLWKVAPEGEGAGFFVSQPALEPTVMGVSLRR